jgi:hypothetical protein
MSNPWPCNEITQNNGGKASNVMHDQKIILLYPEFRLSTERVIVENILKNILYNIR